MRVIERPIRVWRTAHQSDCLVYRVRSSSSPILPFAAHRSDVLERQGDRVVDGFFEAVFAPARQRARELAAEQVDHPRVVVLEVRRAPSLS